MVCVIGFPRGILGTIIHALSSRRGGPRLDEPAIEASGAIGIAASAVAEREVSR